MLLEQNTLIPSTNVPAIVPRQRKSADEILADIHRQLLDTTDSVEAARLLSRGLDVRRQQLGITKRRTGR